MNKQFSLAFKRSCAAAMLIAGSAFLATDAAAVVLPTADCGLGPTNNCIAFNDFNVFSLPLLNLRATGSSVPSPGDPYFAPSTYGAIKDYTIIGINNGQYTSTGNPTGGTDGSYNTPSPNNDTSVTFSTRTTDDPYSGNGNPQTFQSEFFGDAEGSWDATTTSLLSLTNNTPVAFFFAFNETGSGTGLETTDLLIWGMIKLVDAESADVKYLYLGGDMGTNGAYSSNYTPLDDTLPDATGTNSTYGSAGYDFGPWVYVHAGICANAAGDFLGFPETDGSCADPNATVRNQNNLGQNAAAFMVNSPELDAELLTGKWDAVQVTWEMAYINGGGETAWIMPVTATNICEESPTAPGCQTTVPEPNGLALVALGLAIMGGLGYRSARR